MRTYLVVLSLFLMRCAFAQEHDLEFYLTAARLNSPLIQKNKANAKVIELDLEQTKRILKSPVLNLESGVLFAPIISHDASPATFNPASNGATNYLGYDLGATNGGQYQAYVSVNQPLLGNRDLKFYSQKSDILKQQNDNSTRMTTHELEQLVSYQYILSYKARLQVLNDKVMLSLYDDNLQLMEKLVAGAVYKQSDLMLMKIEKQNLLMTLQADDDAYETSRYDLHLLCGITDPVMTDVKEPVFQLNPLEVRNSNFLKTYELDSLTVCSDLAISDLKYKPQLNAFANAGYNATGIPSINRFGFSTGLTFSWNLYDGGQRKLEKSKALHAMEAINYDKTYFITQQKINKSKILSQLRSVTQHQQLLEKQLTDYDKLYHTYELELSQGLVSAMDLKNLLKDMTSKKQEFMLLQAESMILINTYNYWNY